MRVAIYLVWTRPAIFVHNVAFATPLVYLQTLYHICPLTSTLCFHKGKYNAVVHFFLHFFPQKRLNCKRFKKNTCSLPQKSFSSQSIDTVKIIFFAPYKQNSFLWHTSCIKNAVPFENGKQPHVFLTVHSFYLQNSRLHCFTKRRLS